MYNAIKQFYEGKRHSIALWALEVRGSNYIRSEKGSIMYKNVKLPDTAIFDDNMSKLFYEQNPFLYTGVGYSSF